MMSPLLSHPHSSKQPSSSGFRRFRRFRSGRSAPVALALAVMVALLVVLSACSSAPASTGNNGNNGNNGTSPTATVAATATPLSSVPQITLAFCQGLVSLSDANSIMKPATPATSIVPDNARPGGSCSYVYGTSGLVLSIYFQPFPQGISINAYAQQQLAKIEAQQGIPAGMQVTYTPVSGIGDQALYVSLSGTYKGITGYSGELVMTIGRVFVSCFNLGLGTPTTPQQPALTQVCTQVASRL